MEIKAKDVRAWKKGFKDGQRGVLEGLKIWVANIVFGSRVEKRDPKDAERIFEEIDRQLNELKKENT